MFQVKFIRKADKKTLSQIISIYKTEGWWEPSDNEKRLAKIIKGSYLFSLALSSGKIAGMARIISDGVNDAYIQDLAVIPEYRGKGAGGKILSALASRLKKDGFKWIGLISQGNNEAFYLKNGFRKMKNSRPMIYDKF